MNQLDQIPLWAAIPIALLLVIGSTLTLLGNVGLIRMRRFYERLHAPTLGTSWGTAATILASMGIFSMIEQRPVVHELVIGVFVMITTPITLLLLGRASLRRDRAKNSPELAEVAMRRPARQDDAPEAAPDPVPDDPADSHAGNEEK